MTPSNFIVFIKSILSVVLQGVLRRCRLVTFLSCPNTSSTIPKMKKPATYISLSVNCASMLIQLIVFSSSYSGAFSVPHLTVEAERNFQEPLFKLRPSGTLAREQRCINIGSNSSTDSVFLPEYPYVRYHGKVPWVRSFANYVEATRHQSVFRTQRVRSSISFTLIVPTGYSYVLTFGFAQVSACIEGRKKVLLQVGRSKSLLFDTVELVGCRRAHFVMIDEVEPSESGVVNVTLSAKSARELENNTKGIQSFHPKNRPRAMLAALCVLRGPRVWKKRDFQSWVSYVSHWADNMANLKASHFLVFVILGTECNFSHILFFVFLCLTEKVFALCFTFYIIFRRFEYWKLSLGYIFIHNFKNYPGEHLRVHVVTNSYLNWNSFFLIQYVYASFSMLFLRKHRKQVWLQGLGILKCAREQYFLVHKYK